MTARELIEALQAFPPNAGVCVEVNQDVILEVFEDDTSYFDVDTVSPECRNGNAIKLTLI